jgi:hypothetical protein
MKYSGPETEAMSALASAAKKRSLAEFNEVSDFSNCKNFGEIRRMYRKNRKTPRFISGLQEIQGRIDGRPGGSKTFLQHPGHNVREGIVPPNSTIFRRSSGPYCQMCWHGTGPS